MALPHYPDEERRTIFPMFSDVTTYCVRLKIWRTKNLIWRNTVFLTSTGRNNDGQNLSKFVKLFNKQVIGGDERWQRVNCCFVSRKESTGLYGAETWILYRKQISFTNSACATFLASNDRWLKERFLIRRNRTKRAHFRCNYLFQAMYNTTENS